MNCDCGIKYRCSYHKGYRNIKVGTRTETKYEIMERSKLVHLFFRKLWNVLYDLEKFINQYEKEIEIEVDIFENRKVS